MEEGGGHKRTSAHGHKPDEGTDHGCNQLAAAAGAWGGGWPQAHKLTTGAQGPLARSAGAPPDAGKAPAHGGYRLTAAVRALGVGRPEALLTVGPPHGGGAAARTVERPCRGESVPHQSGRPQLDQAS